MSPCGSIRVPKERTKEAIGEAVVEMLQSSPQFGDDSCMRQPPKRATPVEWSCPESMKHAAIGGRAREGDCPTGSLEILSPRNLTPRFKLLDLGLTQI